MDDVLRYESRDKAALEPGEELLWEGGGKKRGSPEYRITNRRAFYFGKLKKTVHLQPVRWPFRDQIAVRTKRSKATIKLGNRLWITGVESWTEAVAHLARMKQHRLPRRRRRSSPYRKLEASMESVLPVSENRIDYSSVATDLGLIEGERVIWTGKPRVKWRLSWPELKGKLRTLGWLIIPSVLAYYAKDSDQIEPVRLGYALISAVWFFFSLKSILIRPVADRWKLRRTQYALTSRRVFIIGPQAGGRAIRFVFIDALPAQFERTMQTDGSGELKIGLAMAFRQIPDAMAVHQQLVDAVLNARRDLPDLGWQETPSIDVSRNA